MYFPAEMLKPMLCMHERLLQEAPCQRGMTNKDDLAVMLRTCIHILRSLQGSGGCGRPCLSLMSIVQSSRVARGRSACGWATSHGAAQVAPLWETKSPPVLILLAPFRGSAVDSASCSCPRLMWLPSDGFHQLH